MTCPSRSRPPGRFATAAAVVALALATAAFASGPPTAAAADTASPSAPSDACTGQRFIEQRVACYSDRAVAKGDPRLCLKDPDPDARWPCVAKYAVVAGTAATCELLAESPGNAGAEGQATAAASGDPDQAMDPRVSVDLCLSALALVWRRPALCRRVQTATMGDSCLAKLVAIGGDPALCGQIQSEDLRKVCRPDPANGRGE
jgi:hypothetical protein